MTRKKRRGTSRARTMTTLEPYSSEYYLLDAATLSHPSESVIVPQDLYNGLCRYVNEPMIRVGSEHRWLIPEGAVPAETVVLPEELYHEDTGPLLVAKHPAEIEDYVA